ncbi:MAG: hypothetical protein AAFU79_32965 [Myxococcota bacterium]
MSAADDLVDELTRPKTGQRIIGIGKMAKRLDLEPGKRWGKWCSQCQGLWFGWLFEVECPKCGHRRG